MKEIIAAKVTIVDFFVFYQLLQDSMPIHLTFSAQEHEETAERLQNMSYPVSPLEKRLMSLSELIEMLSSQKSFANFSLSIFIRNGTPFQQQVWSRICLIPFGQTKTYGSLACELGNKALVRAAGQACGANPITLLIPCHRVVGHAGLGGYTGGINLKKKLLELEAK